MDIQKFVEETNDLNVKDWRLYENSHFALGLCGEAGEIADNTKKHGRWLKGWEKGGIDDTEYVETLRDEIPDVIIYACLLAGKHNLRIDKLVEDKVAEIKIRFGWK